MPQGYPGLPGALGPAQQPAPAVNSPPTGFALPQPTASGSLDLSKIKPTASGRVSLDDALAKVKAKAAEMGVHRGDASNCENPQLSQRRRRMARFVSLTLADLFLLQPHATMIREDDTADVRAHGRGRRLQDADQTRIETLTVHSATSVVDAPAMTTAVIAIVLSAHHRDGEEPILILHRQDRRNDTAGPDPLRRRWNRSISTRRLLA
jgi:hypothetical protein